MKEQQQQTKAELVRQVQQTSNPVAKRVLEKRISEIDKEVKK